ncbi:hypothetical protein GF325_02750 [Candidatus Bathyarchaeota archaeon]|nr:hypothetical protein [Candidatus Bathyarchaeota archaeon]
MDESSSPEKRETVQTAHNSEVILQIGYSSAIVLSLIGIMGNASLLGFTGGYTWSGMSISFHMSAICTAISGFLILGIAGNKIKPRHGIAIHASAGAVILIISNLIGGVLVIVGSCTMWYCKVR